MDYLVNMSNVNYSCTNEKQNISLSDITLSIAPYEFIALIESQNCRKSLLLSLICGLISPTSGTIETNCSHIGYMKQNERFLEWRTLYYNIMLGLSATDDHKTAPSISKDHSAYVTRMINTCGIKECKDLLPSEVSDCVVKKAALIRALAVEPELILLDNVFSSLDYDSRISLSEEMRTILKKEEKTVVLATHDIKEAICFADRVVVLSKEGNIEKIVSISFDDLDYAKGDVKKSDKFFHYFNEIWRGLHNIE